ncbi:hypothetical protein [Mycolicibacterium goodii]|uniref:DUF1844 domain-containing protein n=1 Tax=Mycolicibacterium goodii TaxID=134601 RepID=A0ABS6I0L2_MYCGD|nr:hypothetical protein [Mycolicibacterium goodii]MBU8814336.1 hypothetical protein [Mycolicibacterium goodii]MBU8827740.1 hypothetical protein [Mycolicibacterium goodii]MBU8840766.1 hypothetical protein [Mycolicibacterium goodii]
MPPEPDSISGNLATTQPAPEVHPDDLNHYLEQARIGLELMNKAGATGDAVEFKAQALHLAEHFESLDHALRTGAELPTDWRVDSSPEGPKTLDRIEAEIDLIPGGAPFTADEENLLVSAIKMVRTSMSQRLPGSQGGKA